MGISLKADGFTSNSSVVLIFYFCGFMLLKLTKRTQSLKNIVKNEYAYNHPKALKQAAGVSLNLGVSSM